MKSRIIPQRLGIAAGVIAATGLLLIGGACANVSAQDVKGILEAANGKEVTIKMDDGTTVRITVTKAGDTAQAEALVGQPVTAKVNTDKEGKRQLVSVRKDEHKGVFFGVVKSLSANNLVVEEKTFKIDSSTQKDPELKAGMTVKVTFAKQEDGSLLAIEIREKHEDNGVRARGEPQDKEKDKGNSGRSEGNRNKEKGDDEFTGIVKTLTANSITVGDRTFKITADTEKEGEIKVGATVEVEYATLPDGTFVASEIEAKKVAPAPGTTTPPAGTNTPPVTTPAPTTTVAPVSYAATIQPLFNQYCTECHGASATGGVDLRTYASAMASHKINAGNAAGSKLYRTLTGNGGEQMPPSGRLPSASIQAVANWINQGALNN